MNTNPIIRTTSRAETLFQGEWPTINELRAALDQLEAAGAPLDKPTRMRPADASVARRHGVPLMQRTATNVLLCVVWE